MGAELGRRREISVRTAYSEYSITFILIGKGPAREEAAEDQVGQRNLERLAR